MTVREDIEAIYWAVHEDADHPMDGRLPTDIGQHRAIWDAIRLLASRIDGDITAEPRAERTISVVEFTTDDPSNV